MKKKMKSNLLLIDLCFIGFIFVCGLILYSLNICFRLWLLLFLIVISFLGFLIGIIQILKKELSSIYRVAFLLLILVVVIPIFLVLGFFFIHPEYTVEENRKKYVVIRYGYMPDVEECYYDSLGPFFRGREVRFTFYRKNLER